MSATAKTTQADTTNEKPVAKTRLTAEAAPEPVALPRVQARSDIIKLKEHVYNTWSIIAPPDHSLEQVCDLRYAWHAHDRIVPGDFIEIRSASFRFFVSVLVKEIDREAQAILGYYTVRDLTKEDLRVPDLSGANVVLMGGPHGWAIMLGSQHLRSGFETEGEAVAYLRKKQSRGN